MSLSITNNTGGMLRALYQTKTRMERTFTHLATGKRIAGASDDAAGLAISKRLEAQVRGLSQGERNLADGVSYTRTAEGTMQSSHETLHRMRELSVQAQNGTLNDADRATIQQEFDQLAAQLDQIAPETGSTTFTDGNDGEITVAVSDMSAGGLGVSGLSASDPATMSAIDGAIDQVSSARGALGTAANQLTSRTESLGAARANTEAARSRIEDADYAREVADLTRDRILQNMQLSGLVMAGRNSRAALDLLG